MNALDNQKDFYIKSKLKNDDLISKKADDVFNNFFKGEVKMEENVKREEKVVDINTAKNKRIKAKRILSIAATFMVMFLGANVYAATQGYNNIFFIIKNLVTPEIVTEKEQILLDRDITISYQPIEIAHNLKMQINKLVVKENEATLYIRVEEIYPLDYLPTKYCVYDVTDGKKTQLCEQYTTRENENISELIGFGCTEELNLFNFTNETKEIQLEVHDQEDSLIVALQIDIENKEIDVLNSKAQELEKISETELKSILGLYTNLNMYDDLFNKETKMSYVNKEEFINTKLVENAIVLLTEKENTVLDQDGIDAEVMHNIIKEMTGKVIEKPINLVNSIISYDSASNRYKIDAGDGLGRALCLDIQDINYYDGIYTVEYIYCYPSESDYIDNTIENLDRFKTTMKLKINKNYELAKYCLVNLDELESESYENNSNNKINIPNDETKNKNQQNNNTVTYTNTTTVIPSTSPNYSYNTVTPNYSTNTTVPLTPNYSSNIVEIYPTTNQTNNKVDNYASSMEWTYLDSVGLRTKIPAMWNVEVINESFKDSTFFEVATRVSGLAQGINRETNEIINSNVTLNFYSPKFVEARNLEEFQTQVANEFGGEVSEAGYVKDNEFDLEWHMVIGENGNDYYCHYEPSSDGGGIGYIVEVSPDIWFNYKVINILNWIFEDLRVTSF